jgi:hypothetical protein
MVIFYKNLDELTRKYMLEELEWDIANGNLYISKSPRLTSEGQSESIKLLREAIISYNDDWLANQLRAKGYMKTYEERRLQSGKIISAKVPINAHETLAEGEFNRYYARGLCKRAIAEGIKEVVVYRGKQVERPRLQSQAMLGKSIDAKALLEDLRKSPGVEPALGVPPGPNSGLTICLP